MNSDIHSCFWGSHLAALSRKLNRAPGSSTLVGNIKGTDENHHPTG
jgi:hypothetical protein